MFRKSILAVSLTAVFIASAIFPAWSQAPPVALPSVKANVGHHVTIKGPTDVPVGGLCLVIVEGLKPDDSLSWVAVPFIEIADLLDRQGRPVLIVPTNISGVYHLVLAFSDDGKVGQKTHTVRVGQPITPVPPGPNVPPVVTPPVVTPPTVPVDPTTKATAATFVYEKDEHIVPAAVLSALNKLNRDRKIVATLLDDDTTNGGGNIPEQYKLVVPAARRAGLPALVVSDAKGVIAVAKDPKTEEDVFKAVP